MDDHVQGLTDADKAAIAGMNVFPFSMGFAGHGVLQLVGLATGFARVNSVGAQRYDCYPGEMRALRERVYDVGCEFSGFIASAVDCTPSLATTIIDNYLAT